MGFSRGSSNPIFALVEKLLSIFFQEVSVGSNPARSGQEVLFIVTNFFESTLYVILAEKKTF